LLLICGAVVGGILLLAGIGTALVLALRSDKAADNQVANANVPAQSEDKKPQPDPDKKPPDVQPDRDKTPPEKPTEPTDPIKPKDPVPPPKDPAPENPGAVPEIPPLPPVKDRPMLVLDAGGHSSIVKSVLFTPDGRRVVTVSEDKTVRLHDVGTGETLRTYRLPIGPGDEGSLYGAAISPDGKRLAVSGMPFGRGKFGMLIHVLSLETGRVERVLKGHKEIILRLTFSADGKYLASCSPDKTAIVYAVETGEIVTRLEGHTDGLTALAFSPDGELLATASGDKTVRVWTLKEPREVKVLQGHTKGTYSVAWAPDGKTLASSGTDGTVRLWTREGAAIKTVAQLKDPDRNGREADIQVTSLRFTADGRELLFTGIGWTGKAGLLTVADGTRRVDFPEHTNTVMSGTLSPDGTLAASCGGNDNETYIWRTADGSVVQKLVGAGRAVWAVGWSLDGKSLCWGNTNRTPDKTKPQAQAPLERSFNLDELDFGGGAPPRAVRGVLGDGTWSLEAVDFFKIMVKRGGKPVGTLHSPNQGERLYSMTLLPGGRAVLGGSPGLYLIDLATGKLVRQFFGHSRLVTSVASSPKGDYFVTGTSDETVRVWKADKEEPVLSLFVAGYDWIAWTPEGYYAASAYGERLMGWQINNGPEQLASYYPSVQFHNSLFQPEVIGCLISSGSLPEAIARANKERKKPIAAVHVGQVLPPKVTITAPDGASGEVKIDKAQLEVKATASSAGDNPVTALRLLVDGRPYMGRKGVRRIDAPKPGTVDAAWTVVLPQGKYTLTVQAESAVSKGLSPTVEVTRASDGKQELPNLYILAVGVSDYPGKLKLRYAASDAELIAKVFREKTGSLYGKVEVKLVTDAEATKDGILKGLAWLESVMTPLDVGVFFFSGHGARVPDGTFYLVPVNASPSDLEGTLVSGDVLKQTLADIPGRLVAMLDCCHSGSVADQLRPSRVDGLARDLVTDEYGVVVMCSSLGRESSLESSATKAGFFTLSVVEGLSGRADFNKDKVIHLHELDQYTAQRVKELSGGVQNPVTGRPPSVRSFPLARP
jgi:WD40 repeat protein